MDVVMPDGTIIKDVPEGTTKSDLQRRLQAYQGPQASPAQASSRQAFESARQARNSPKVAPQAPPTPSFGLMRPLTEMGMKQISSAVAMPVSGLIGLGYAGGKALGLTDKNPADVVEGVQNAMTIQPSSAEGVALDRASSYLPGKLAEGADWVGQRVSDAYGPAAGTAANVGVQALPAIFLKGKSGSIANLDRGLVGRESRSAGAIANAERSAKLEGVPPTIEELGKQSKAAYKRASDAGANIAPDSFKNLKNRINVDLKKEGLDPTLHPKTTAALKRINDTKGAVTLDELETLRRIAKDAGSGIDKADGRLAGRIVDELDDYTDRIGPKDITTGDPGGFAALKEARNLYSRKAKSEEIAELVRRAELSSPNFTASGMENALRTEFRGLAKNARKMRRFTPEERAAIEKVAKGGKTENALRMLGKFAPHGVVSTALYGGAGFAVGGPVGAVALPAVGLAGRYAATRMTKANVLRAEETMRRGPPQKSRNALKDLEKVQ